MLWFYHGNQLVVTIEDKNRSGFAIYLDTAVRIGRGCRRNGDWKE